MNLFPYIAEYFKINQFALYLVSAVVLTAVWPYFKISIRISPKVALAGILLLGIALRLAWLGFSSHEPKMNWGPNLLDNDWIHIQAIELTQGKWFLNADGVPSGRRPIGYPLFIGLLYKIFGVHIKIVWAAQLVLSVVCIYFLYLIGKSIFNERVGLWTAFFFSIYPTAIYSIKLITDEHLFLSVWYFGLLLLFREIQGRPLKWNWLWYGLIFGYATMIRTHTIFMPAVAGLTAFFLKRSWKNILGVIMLTVLVMQLINLPWIIRNYKTWGVPVLYTATACFVYTQVNSNAVNEEGAGRVPQRGEPGFSEELEKAYQSGNEGLAHKICGRETKRWILSHPVEFVFMGIRKLLVLMNWNRSGGVWPLWYQYTEGHFDPARPLSDSIREIFQEAAFISYYVLLFLFLFSFFPMTRSWKAFSPATKISLLILGSCFLFWFAEHMVIYAFRKYRYPLEPLMMILAVYFLGQVNRFCGRARQRI